MKNIFYFLLLGFFVSHAQLDQYQVYTGLIQFKKNSDIDIRGIDKNAFAKFKDTPLIGVGFSMFVNDNVRLGANFEGTPLPANKKNYSMSFFSINPTANFHIIPFNKKVSPFISANLNFSFLNFSQKAHIETIYPSKQYSVSSTSNPIIISEEISKPYFKMKYQPIAGGGLGLGVDFKIKKHFGLVIVANYNTLISKTNPVINKNLTYNKHNLSYTTLSLMLRYRIF